MKLLIFLILIYIPTHSLKADVYLDWDLYWLNEGGNAVQMCIREVVDLENYVQTDDKTGRNIHNYLNGADCLTSVLKSFRTAHNENKIKDED